jgi:hypothetical protein
MCTHACVGADVIPAKDVLGQKRAKPLRP